MVPMRQRGQAMGRPGRSLVSPTAAAPPTLTSPLRGLPPYVRGNAVIGSWARGGGCQVAYNFQRNNS
jgi:hypothetical protein